MGARRPHNRMLSEVCEEIISFKTRSKEDIARKWLGRDIFTIAGLDEPSSSAPHFIRLTHQYRMAPEISRISNSLIYDSLLQDCPSDDGQSDFDKWYRTEWQFDTPVLLVDTEHVHAWVTSVAGQSRLNFLSATICVDVAEQILGENCAAGA